MGNTGAACPGSSTSTSLFSLLLHFLIRGVCVFVCVCVVGKLVGRLVQNRLQQIAESELPDTQCGFRKGRSCTDQIFSARQLIEKFYEHRTPGFLVFIDLKKAYDSVSREALWRGLQILGVPPTLMAIIASFHQDMTAQVHVGNSHTERIDVKNGLHQGCCMAPMLFNVFFLRWSLRSGKWNSPRFALKVELTSSTTSTATFSIGRGQNIHAHQ